MNTTAELRDGYLDFFESKGHTRLPSASLVPPPDDPTTFLISAGMHPLKPYFLGVREPPSKLLTTVQKCFRTVDIDGVGLDGYHLTLFEMLGNFSIGQYFKEGAIEYAWEFMTEHLHLDMEKVHASVFAGDPELARGQLLAGGRDRPVRTVFRDVLRPRAGAQLRAARLRARVLVRALPRVLEPRLHGVRPAR
jgi:alanyl-tRNA synthetase